MTEDGHDDSDVYAVLNEKRGGRVATVVDSNISHARLTENVFPLLPVVSRIDWAAVRPAEHEIAVFPLLASREPFPKLRLPVRLKNWNELRRERHSPLALALRFTEDETTTDTLRTDPRVFSAVGRTRLRTTEMTRLRAARRALRSVLMTLTALRTRRLVKPLSALVRVITTMAPSRPLNLPPDTDLHRVEIDVLPAEPESFTLTEPQSEPH